MRLREKAAAAKKREAMKGREDEMRGRNMRAVMCGRVRRAFIDEDGRGLRSSYATVSPLRVDSTLNEPALSALKPIETIICQHSEI